MFSQTPATASALASVPALATASASALTGGGGGGGASNPLTGGFPAYAVRDITSFPPSSTATATTATTATNNITPQFDSKRKRAAKACDSCRRKRTKCILLETEAICEPCRINKCECVFVENSKKRGRRLGNDIDTFASGSGSNTASVVDNAYSHPHSSTSQNYQTMYHHQQQQPQHVYNTSHHTPSHTNIPQYYPRPSSSTAAAVAKDPTYHYRSSELSGQTLTSSASVQFVNNNSSMVSPPPPRIRPYQVTASPSTDSSSSTSSSAVLTSTSVSTTTPPLAESTITMLESKIQHLEEMLKSVVKSQQQQQEKALTKVSTSHQKRQSPIGNSNAITSSSSSVPTTSASNSNSSSSRQGMMNDGITIVQDGTTNTMRFFGSTSVSSSAVVYESPRYNNGVLTLYLQLDPRTLQDFSFGHTRDSLDSPLCSSDLMLHLVNHYFAYIHPYFPMIDKAHFLRQLRDRETGGPFGVLLHAVLALVVQYTSCLKAWGVSNHMDLHFAFTRRVKLLLAQFLDHPHIMTVQALLIMTLCGLGVTESINPWVYSGIALRQALELGLHRNLTKHNIRLRIDAGMLETMKRTWFVLYILDRYCSILSGRPLGIRDDDWDTAWPGQQQQHHQQHHPSSSSSMTGQHQHAASATSAAVATATSSSSFNSKDSNVFVDSSSSCPHSAGAALPLLSSSNGETRESLQLAPTATISSTSSIIPSSSQDGVQEEENYHGGNGNEEEEEGEEDKEERGGNFNNNCNEDVFQFHAPPPPQPDIGIGKLLDGTEGTASSIPIPAPCSAAAAENKCNGGSSSSSSSPSCTSAPQSESSANHHQYSHHHHHHFYHQQQQRPFSMSAIIEGLQPPIASDPTDAKAVRYLVLHVGLARVLGDINYLANSAIVEGDRGELIERAREMLDDWISKLGETMMPEDVVDLGNTISGGGGSNRQLSPASWKDGRGSLGAWGIKHSFSVMYHTASILLTRLNEGRIDDRCAPSATALTRILDYMPLPSKDNEGLGYCYYIFPLVAYGMLTSATCFLGDVIKGDVAAIAWFRKCWLALKKIESSSTMGLRCRQVIDEILESKGLNLRELVGEEFWKIGISMRGNTAVASEMTAMAAAAASANGGAGSGVGNTQHHSMQTAMNSLMRGASSSGGFGGASQQQQQHPPHFQPHHNMHLNHQQHQQQHNHQNIQQQHQQHNHQNIHQQQQQQHMMMQQMMSVSNYGASVDPAASMRFTEFNSKSSSSGGRMMLNQQQQHTSIQQQQQQSFFDNSLAVSSGGMVGAASAATAPPPMPPLSTHSIPSSSLKDHVHSSSSLSTSSSSSSSDLPVIIDGSAIAAAANTSAVGGAGFVDSILNDLLSGTYTFSSTM